MRKFSFYFTCLFILISLGCGSTSGDPTARITLEATDAGGVAPGGSTVITAIVTKAGGTTAVTGTTTTTTSPGWGENVTFKFLTANGAHLSILTQKTDGDGKARTVYTAGNNLNEDIIQATLDNGMSTSVVIKKTGTILGASITLTATPVSVRAFGYSTIQATVMDSDSRPVSGATIEFKLAENNSGASLIIQNVVTDAAGQATVTYRAGGNEPSQDVVQAKLLSNGAVSSVIISVTGGGAGPAISAMTAEPASVKAGQQSKVVVTVTDDNNQAVAGEQVTIEIYPNNSGASLIIQNSYTDALGQVVATYVAGTQSPLAEVTDTVQAQVVSSGSVNSVIITVTPTVTP